MPTLFASGEFADAIGLIRQFGPFFLAVVFFLCATGNAKTVSPIG